MTVAELKARFPEADVYHLDPDATLLIFVKREQMDMKTLDELSHFLGQHVKMAIVAVDDPANDVRLFEVKI
jgi:hypothetical protein